MPREKKYTARTLEKAAREYFERISRVREITESVSTGELDQYGHMVMKRVPVLNVLGEPVTVTEFVVPPTVGGLCAALHISRTTWRAYCDSGDEDMQAVTADICDTLLEWNERELLTRPGKDIQGVVFNLKNNYGYSDRAEPAAERDITIEGFLAGLGDG